MFCFFVTIFVPKFTFDFAKLWIVKFLIFTFERGADR